jgi:hypothetical protein
MVVALAIDVQSSGADICLPNGKSRLINHILFPEKATQKPVYIARP